MTTIAYKDGIIAYDSQATRGDTIVNRSFNKRKSFKGFNFFFAGSVNKIDLLIESFFTSEPVEKTDSSYAFVVTPDKQVLLAFFDYDKVTVTDGVDNDEIYSIRSGADYAIGAMDAGATAKEAVKIACMLDVYSGGTVREFKIKND